MGFGIYKLQALVIEADDLPATYAGLSVYRGVLVCWDADHDTRVLRFLDWLADTRPVLLAALAVVHERKGTLDLIWDGPVPNEFRVDVQLGADVPWPIDDVWIVATSRELNTPRRTTP